MRFLSFPRKALVVLSTLSLLVSGCSCNGKPGKATHKPEVYDARISFCDSIHNFGTFPADNPLQKHTFTFTNNGDVPAVLLSVSPSCKCTSAEYTRSVIRPGEKGTVTVVFDGRKVQPGYFSKSVRIRINSPYVYTLGVEGKME